MTESSSRPATKTTRARKTTDTDLPELPPADDSGPHIGTTQMRQLHALLRDHGITTDRAVYGYLTLYLGRDITSRRTITASEAGHLIADLERAEVATVLNHRALAGLRAPFAPEAIGKLPRSTCRACSKSERKRCDQHTWVSRCDTCNGSHSAATMHIDFVGHADVTDRLLAVDPAWTWEPMATDPHGLPVLDRFGGLWITLTVCGVTRPGYGDSENGKGMKEAIGDALRNAAMRFGVALDLWAKGDRDWARAEKHGTDIHPDQAPPREAGTDAPAPDQPPARQPDDLDNRTTDDLLLILDQYATEQGVTYDQFTEKWRRSLGIGDVDDLDSLAPGVVAEQIRRVRAFLGKS